MFESSAWRLSAAEHAWGDDMQTLYAMPLTGNNVTMESKLMLGVLKK